MKRNKTALTKWDSAAHLKNEDDIAGYLEAAFEIAGDDPAFIAKSLGIAAKARGMTKVAGDAGISREGLYKALSGESKPEFATILKVIGALGLKLHVSTIR